MKLFSRTNLILTWLNLTCKSSIPILTKKAYLIEIKADFLQSENICSISANKSFAENIDIELAKIEKIEKLPSGNEAICQAIAPEKNWFKTTY